MSVYKPVIKTFDLADGTPVELILPMGSKEHLIQVTPDTAFVLAFDDSLRIAADDAIEFKAGAAYTIDSPVAQTKVYVQQDSGAPVRLRWAYLQPTIR